MKAILYSTLTIVLTSMFFLSCENETDKGQQIDFVGELISASTCKNELKSASVDEDVPDSLSCIEYLYDDENKKLSIKHINAGFNCCPDSLYCTISLKLDTIIIKEFEKIPQCNCNCLYDLDIVVNGVDKKIYQIKLIEPYSDEQAELKFEIDLNIGNEGSFCVTRKNYPWGMNFII